MGKIRYVVAFLISVFFLTSCSQSDDVSCEELKSTLCDGNYITNVREEVIEIPGIKEVYNFLYIADLHIIVPSDAVTEADLETVDARYNTWQLT